MIKVRVYDQVKVFDGTGSLKMFGKCYPDTVYMFGDQVVNRSEPTETQSLDQIHSNKIHILLNNVSFTQSTHYMPCKHWLQTTPLMDRSIITFTSVTRSFWPEVPTGQETLEPEQVLPEPMPPTVGKKTNQRRW